jgi:hypothetical protein
LDHIAINVYLALAKQARVNDRSQAAADQTLYFLRPTRWAALSFSLSSRIRSPGQHRIFGSDPANTLVP